MGILSVPKKSERKKEGRSFSPLPYDVSTQKKRSTLWSKQREESMRPFAKGKQYGN